MSHVFISYSSEDSDFVQKLANRLTRSQFNIWIDRQGLRGGDIWIEKLPKVIDASGALMLVVSENSVKSNWVKKEYGEALTLEKRIIPYVLSTSDDLNQFAFGGQIKAIFNTSSTAFEDLCASLPADAKTHFNSLQRKEDLLRLDMRSKTDFVAVSSSLDQEFPEIVVPLGDNGNFIELKALPLHASQYCRSYLIGRATGKMTRQPKVQLALQASGPYLDTDFVVKIARHFLSIDPEFNLNLLLICGPIQVKTEKDIISASYGLDVDKPDEWNDIVQTAEQALRIYARGSDNPDLQIFVKGPAIMLYKLGVLCRMYIADIFHYDSFSKNYYHVLTAFQRST